MASLIVVCVTLIVVAVCAVLGVKEVRAFGRDLAAATQRADLAERLRDDAQRAASAAQSAVAEKAGELIHLQLELAAEEQRTAQALQRVQQLEKTHTAAQDVADLGRPS